MNRTVALCTCLVLTLTLAACQMQESYGGKLILYGNHTIASGQTLDGDLLVNGGVVEIERGALVAGSLYMIGGSVNVDGTIQGDVALLGGTLQLGPQAHIEDNLEVGGGTLEQAPGAVISGTYNPGTGLQIPARSEGWGENLLTLFLQALVLAALAALAARFLQRPLSRVEHAAIGHPVVSGALGLLTLIVLPALLVQMAFTIILIPVTLLGIALLLAITAFGWVAIGLRVGNALARISPWHMGDGSSAFTGTLTLIIAVSLLAKLPVIGTVILVLAAAVAIGAVLLTRFGITTFVPATELADLSQDWPT